MRKIVTDILEGGISIKAVLRWLRDNQVGTVRGGPWNGRSL